MHNAFIRRHCIAIVTSHSDEASIDEAEVIVISREGLAYDLNTGRNSNRTLRVTNFLTIQSL